MAPPPETSCPILERHCLKCARNLHPATGEEPRVRFDIPFGGNRTFSVRLKIALSGSLGQAVTFAVVRRDRSVPEVLTFQTKSLGDGVYRLSPFTPGAYEIFAQVRGAASQMDIQTGRMSVNIGNDEVDAGMLAVRPNGTLAGRIMIADPLSVALDPARLEWRSALWRARLRPWRQLHATLAAC